MKKTSAESITIREYLGLRASSKAGFSWIRLWSIQACSWV